MALERNRFLQPPQPPAPRRKRWGSCWGGLSFFHKQKGGKRIVPAFRVPEANALTNQPNGPRIGGLPNQPALSIFAPPSSPASFSNSTIPSTVQSPSCFLSASSPGGPSSTMFVTGPYAHETQLVSPPVFSTFTTEPSTAPLTPPPELAHLTTPSSPDVPYARFLSSSAKIKGSDKSGYVSGNDFPASYSPYPESPASTLRSPVSRTPGNCISSSSCGERAFPSHWDISQDPRSMKLNSGRFLGVQTNGATKSRQDSNFFCPETFAQFYDLSSFSNSGGRLSISKESDAYSGGGNAYQCKQSKNCKPDAEELEAYRASFGFSADELITTNYVEISDMSDDSFSVAFLNSQIPPEREVNSTSTSKSPTLKERKHDLFYSQLVEARLNHTPAAEDNGADKQCGHPARLLHDKHISSDDEDIFSGMQSSRSTRKYPIGSSNSMQKSSTGEHEACENVATKADGIPCFSSPSHPHLLLICTYPYSPV